MAFINRWHCFLFAFAVVLALPAAADDVAQCAEHGIAGDYQSAYPFCKRAAEQGDGDAQVLLGLIYALGDDSITKDPQEAYVWLLLAANNGNEIASQVKEMVEQELTASERRAAAKEAKRRQQKY